MAKTRNIKKLLFIAAVPQTLRCFLLPFAQHFRSQGWQVDAMAKNITNCPQCQQAFDQTWEVDLARSPLNWQNLFSAPQQIRDGVVRESYDIVHVHMAVAAFITRYALKDLRKKGTPKVIYTSHGFNFHGEGDFFRNTAFLYLEKIAGHWTDDLIVMNQADTEAAKAHHLVPPEKIHYMPGIGVDLAKYSKAKVSPDQAAQVLKELNLSSDTAIFLSIAELIPRKRHQDILKAFAKANASKACLLLAGNGPLKSKLKQLSAELGISEKVRFLGFREDIPTLLRVATATVLVSDQEGLPRSVMESMGLGVPVIGTAIRGTQDLLQEGCGYLVPVGDIDALAKAFLWFLENPESGRRMGLQGQKNIHKYDLKEILRMHESLYETAVGHPTVTEAASI